MSPFLRFGASWSLGISLRLLCFDEFVGDVGGCVDYCLG